MPDYILEPIETDPDELLEMVTDEISNQFPDWQPSEAQLDWIIARIFALHQALVADSASMVMRGIYRYFGATIVNIQPLNGTNATVQTTWVAQDDAGYTLSNGTQLGIRNVDTQDLVLFNVEGDWVIPEGSTQMEGVLLIAEDEGVSGNKLTGLVEQVESVDWAINAFTSTTSTGGTDPENDADYLNRMTTNLGLMTPRPVLAEDFAQLAHNISGVWRSVAIDNYSSGINTIHRWDIIATGGSFILKQPLGSIESNPIPWNATADQFAAALAPLAIEGIYPTDYRVTGGPFPAQSIFIEWIGQYGETDVDVNILTVQSSALTGTGHDIDWVKTQTGSGGDPATESAVSVSGIDVDGNQLSAEKIDELVTYLQSMRAQNFRVYFVDPAYNTVEIQATVYRKVPYDANDVWFRSVAALNEWLSPANWGQIEWPPDARGWGQSTVLRHQDIMTVLNNIEGVDYVDPLNFGTNGGPLDTTDKVLSGTFPLTKPNIIEVTVAT